MNSLSHSLNNDPGIGGLPIYNKLMKDKKDDEVMSGNWLFWLIKKERKMIEKNLSLYILYEH